MANILLIDFGSTYTKVTVVDDVLETIVATAQSFTTVLTDVGEGLENALSKLTKSTGLLQFDKTLACSSAAGGLRMMASGLVPELTAKAAKLASLGAGAKLVKVFSYQLTEQDIEEIDQNPPEIFLLVGGTDGGNTDCIIHNATMLNTSKKDFPILISGNRNASTKCRDILGQKETYICENVMPKIDEINITPTQEKIREIFLKRIVHAKGLTKTEALLSDIVMPTPVAVMSAIKLLGTGIEREQDYKGVGELIAIDVGGATTDVFSVGYGTPKSANVMYKGLPEPYIKRTVEGDLGMRYSAQGVAEAVGEQWLCDVAEIDPTKLDTMLCSLVGNEGYLPDEQDFEKLDFALCCGAIHIGVLRHVGTLETVYTSSGMAFVQEGKDLSDVETVIFTGGALIHGKHQDRMVAFAAADVQQNPLLKKHLKPNNPKALIDKNYILASMGLLSRHNPKLALTLMKKELF